MRRFSILAALLFVVACAKQDKNTAQKERSSNSVATEARANANKGAPKAAPDPYTMLKTVTNPNPALLNPKLANKQAPEKFSVEFVTTKGSFIMDVDRTWAPIGVDRFYNLIDIGFFHNVAFFRVIDGFMAQIGIHGDPKITDAWRPTNISDDPVTQSNNRGTVSFATAGPNTRTTQFFINFGNNNRLDRMGFAPFAKVRDMKTVDALFSGYGEGAPNGRGPAQSMLNRAGNEYLKTDFPKMDYVLETRIVETK